MKARMNFFAKAPVLLEAMRALNKAVDESGFERKLLHLVKLRASQINGCSYCVDMHVKEARHDGESEQRLHLVSAWRESPLYSERERAAFEWTEAVTLLPQSKAADEFYAPLTTHFSDEEIVQLTMLIGVINTWNRLCVAFRSQHPVDRQVEAA
ncbi:carboxymuconolactone decarboxylase family protein [Mesorhizobium sp. LHD-90]|uniref:carboxymuconolactone decarboxylase family protein n=1 Tax=Mesorhizobium sp. LHD-90 TaxID=3071414 RepID=UPI0027DF7B05|nr:carboxymuconolactone decarboxylase family protein [Mesorhizobium sp. LHD-90]MDQ6433394.1 carboxymuconolactone decarboxylase family protein [Mesorhizobium sp. LHD-90]